MPIDFTLTAEQRELQLSAREFAREVLGDVDVKTRHLPTPEERFAATRPAYEQMIQAGFLRRIIPSPAGGPGWWISRCWPRSSSRWTAASR